MSNMRVLLAYLQRCMSEILKFIASTSCVPGGHKAKAKTEVTKVLSGPGASLDLTNEDGAEGSPADPQEGLRESLAGSLDKMIPGLPGDDPVSEEEPEPTGEPKKCRKGGKRPKKVQDPEF